jgi:hypothetical protein
MVSTDISDAMISRLKERFDQSGWEKIPGNKTSIIAEEIETKF